MAIFNTSLNWDSLNAPSSDMDALTSMATAILVVQEFFSATSVSP
jgi:hypothetical protein